MLNIRKAGHSELERYYNAMQVDFKNDELIGKLYLHKALTNGSMELLIVYDDEAKIDLAYALCSVRNLYGYVLLKYIAVLPWYRGKGLGIETMRMLNRRYADRQGIVTELRELDGEDEAERMKKLRKFFSRFGYVNVDADYSYNGLKTNVMVKPIKGTEEIGPVVHRIIPDFYSRALPGIVLDKTVRIVRN